MTPFQESQSGISESRTSSSSPYHVKKLMKPIWVINSAIAYQRLLFRGYLRSEFGYPAWVCLRKTCVAAATITMLFKPSNLALLYRLTIFGYCQGSIHSLHENLKLNNHIALQA